MEKIVRYIFFFIVVVFFIGCASSNKVLVIQQPEPGKSLIVGAVLAENNGIDELYRSKTSKITAVVVGKFVKDGKEITKGYRVKTDKNGYFMIQNVMPGSYVLKGIEVDVGYTNRAFITSRWEGDRQHYYNSGEVINYIVRVWPPEQKGKIINLNINYFMLDNAGRVYFDKFKALKNTTLALKDKRYTMANPKKYFKEKYPESDWFK